MQDRTQGRLRGSEEVGEDAILSDGLVARLADHVFENPAMSGGLFVMALTAAAIVSNAMMMQNGHHPDPLFMTRPTPAAHGPVPLPRARVSEPVRSAAPVPVPRAAPAPQPAAPVAAAAPVPDVKLVADVQHALAVRKLYRGGADGIAGSRTRAAIAAYERSAGLPVTGIATADLLARLRTPPRQLAAAKTPSAIGPPPAVAAPPAIPPAPAAAAPALPPPPAAARQALEAIAAPPGQEPAAPAAEPAAVARQVIEPAAAPQVPEPDAPVVDEEPDQTPAVDTPPIQAAEPPPAAAPLPAAAAPPAAAAGPAAAVAPRAAAAPAAPPPVAAPTLVARAAAPAAPDPGLGDRQRYRKVQDALNQAGYGPLPTDGIANEETASAIRRFELDNGLAITGKPSDRVAARLVSIGAMEAN